jgi:branched-chain amino acid transport system substrate-binding protein
MAGAVLFAIAGCLCACSRSEGKEPIKIGVIGEESSVAGASLTKAALMAADEINAHGGVNGRRVQIITYDNHSSAAEGVRAFQRAASDDKVVAVIGSYLSEVALAIEPWSARMHMPFITPGASSSEIPKRVHDDYEHNKFTFQGTTMSEDIAQSVCDFSHVILVNEFRLKKIVIMSEDAAWTKPLDARYTDCLPKAGLEVLDHIRFNPDTTDFTPIFNQIEREHPDVIITGISHVGVQPTVQWHDQQVPIPMAGQSSQATNGTFWKDTNGATEGVITRSTAAPGVALTTKTIAFAEAYTKRYGQPPAYCGYSSYDMVYVIAEAIKRAASTDPDKLVDAIENTDYLGTSGRLQFYGRGDALTHGLKYGPGLVTGVHLQWQSGKQVAIWPTEVANGKIAFPSFIKLAQRPTAK